jgi:hypothetical protein
MAERNPLKAPVQALVKLLKAKDVTLGFHDAEAIVRKLGNGSESDMKASARVLREQLARRRIDIKHGHALDIMSKLSGLQNWHIAKKYDWSLDEHTPNDAGAQKRAIVVRLFNGEGLLTSEVFYSDAADALGAFDEAINGPAQTLTAGPWFQLYRERAGVSVRMVGAPGPPAHSKRRSSVTCRRPARWPPFGKPSRSARQRAGSPHFSRRQTPTASG